MAKITTTTKKPAPKRENIYSEDNGFSKISLRNKFEVGRYKACFTDNEGIFSELCFLYELFKMDIERNYEKNNVLR